MSQEILIYDQAGVPAWETTSFTFPGGEIQVGLPDLGETIEEDITVVARLQSSVDVMRLILTTEILDRVHTGHRKLVIPYFPYARQDRVTQSRVAFSLRSMARIVNDLEYDRVVVLDPHSDVTPALLSRVRVFPQFEIIRRFDPLAAQLLLGTTVLVSPDAGAAKKAQAVAKGYGKRLLTASKVRNTFTGEITGTRVDDPEGLVAGMSCLIIDDICDGGRTFIELAKVLRDRGAASVQLYVTHGIFSKGLGVFRGLIDEIYTTNSFVPVGVLNDSGLSVHVYDIEKGGLLRAS